MNVVNYAILFYITITVLKLSQDIMSIMEVKHALPTFLTKHIEIDYLILSTTTLVTFSCHVINF